MKPTLLTAAKQYVIRLRRPDGSLHEFDRDALAAHDSPLLWARQCVDVLRTDPVYRADISAPRWMHDFYDDLLADGIDPAACVVELWMGSAGVSAVHGWERCCEFPVALESGRREFAMA